MNTIKYTTGRTYDTEQVLEIFVEGSVVDEFGLEEITASFIDSSRHIKGRVNTVVFAEGIGKAVLEAYDAGHYESI